MIEKLVIVGGSLLAVLILAGIAWALRLGGGRIADESEAKAAAEDALSGFEAVTAEVASDGQAALVLGRDGSLALLKMHGTQVAARQLRPPFDTEATPEGLRIATGEARFGRVTIRGVSSIPVAR
jgi:hypothetical protein